MRTKLILPVVDTESGKFDYGRNISKEEYGDMEYEHFRRTNRQVARFVDNMARGISNVDNGRGFREVRDAAEHPDLKFDNEDIEVLLYNAKFGEVDEEFFMSHVQKGDMFILIVNINPDTISGNGESELRYWMRDSIKVIEDNSLPDEVKLRSLQGRNYSIMVGDKEVKLLNCRMVQNFSDKKNPFKFAIIVEKSII